MNPTRGLSWLLAIYFLSGACSLIDEVVWVRLLKLILGNTVYASSVVVSVFLGGLALGALLMSRVAHRVRHPLYLYAALEGVATLSAVATPWVFGWADGLYVWVYRTWNPSPGALLAVQVAVSALVLLVPTLAMGSTLPLLSRVVAQQEGALGRLVGRLYALNMLGACLGTFLAGFVLVRWLGVLGTLYTAAALNLLVALAGLMAARGLATPSLDAPKAEPVAAAGALRGRGLLLAAIAGSGFVSVGYEIVWMRSIVHVIQSADTYVFSSVLVVYLLGNVGGVLIGSRLAQRLSETRAAFGVSLGLLGWMGVLYLPALVLIAKAVMPHTNPWLYEAAARQPGFWALAYPLLHGAVFFLLPSVAMGVGFPLALQAWREAKDEAGRTTGFVYGANTLGAVAGGVAAGFLLIPTLGVQASVTLLGLLGAVLGFALVWRSELQPAWLRKALIAGLPAAAAVAIVTPGDLFKRHFVSYLKTELVEAREGVTTTVSVHREESGELWLCTAGIQVAGDRATAVQRMLGHLGILVHGSPCSVLTIGFGTGESSQCMSLHPLEQLDCVELSPELAELSLKHFTHLNLGEKLHEKVRMTFMDAKNYLHLTPRKYDVITTDSINPKYFAENASLYTKEHFEAARARLEPGGVCVCWFPFTIPAACTKSIMGTFADVFPHTTVWFPTTQADHCLFLVGSEEPQRVSLGTLAGHLRKPEIVRSLAGMGIHHEFDLLTCYLGDETDLRRWLGAYVLNSDFAPFVEFDTGAFLNDEERWRFLSEMAQAMRSTTLDQYLVWDEFDAAAQAHLREDLALVREIARRTLDTVGDPGERMEALKDIVATGKASSLREQLDALLERHPAYATGRILRAAWFLQHGKLAEAEADFGGVLAVDTGNPYALNGRGAARMYQGRLGEALADFSAAIRVLPEYFAAFNNRGNAYVNQGRFREALADLDRALELKPEFWNAYVNRANLHARQRDFERALQDFDRAYALNPLAPEVLHGRATVLFLTGRNGEAASEFSRLLERDPKDVEALRGRAAARARQGDLRGAREDLDRLRLLGAPIDEEFYRQVSRGAR